MKHLGRISSSRLLGRITAPALSVLTILALSGCALSSYGASAESPTSIQDPGYASDASAAAAVAAGLDVFAEPARADDQLPKIFEKDFSGMAGRLSSRLLGMFDDKAVYVSIAGDSVCVSYGSGTGPDDFVGATACQFTDQIAVNPLYVSDPNSSTALFLVPTSCDVRVAGTYTKVQTLKNAIGIRFDGPTPTEFTCPSQKDIKITLGVLAAPLTK